MLLSAVVPVDIEKATGACVGEISTYPYAEGEKVYIKCGDETKVFVVKDGVFYTPSEKVSVGRPCDVDSPTIVIEGVKISFGYCVDRARTLKMVYVITSERDYASLVTIATKWYTDVYVFLISTFGKRYRDQRFLLPP